MDNQDAAETIKAFLEVFPDAKAPDAVSEGKIVKDPPPGSVLVLAPKGSDPSGLIKELKKQNVPGFLRFLDPEDPWLQPMFMDQETTNLFERRYEQAERKLEKIKNAEKT